MKALTQEQMRRRWIALGIVALAYVLSFFQRFAPAGIAPGSGVGLPDLGGFAGRAGGDLFLRLYVDADPDRHPCRHPRAAAHPGHGRLIAGGLGSFMFGLAPTLDWRWPDGR
jgi:hypothetical protein